MTDNERYDVAAHAMQSGVEFEMYHDSKPTEPKHLRAGVNSALANCAGIAKLLITKGIITEEEYVKAMADAMEAEVERYRERAATEVERHREKTAARLGTESILFR